MPLILEKRRCCTDVNVVSDGPGKEAHSGALLGRYSSVLEYWNDNGIEDYTIAYRNTRWNNKYLQFYAPRDGDRSWVVKYIFLFHSRDNRNRKNTF